MAQALYQMYNLQLRLDIKHGIDGGKVSVGLEPAGTVVFFTKVFKDVDSITLTPEGAIERVAIYDFVDAPYPTSFKILLFDKAGARVAGTVSWKARGKV